MEGTNTEQLKARVGTSNSSQDGPRMYGYHSDDNPYIVNVIKVTRKQELVAAHGLHPSGADAQRFGTDSSAPRFGTCLRRDHAAKDKAISVLTQCGRYPMQGAPHTNISSHGQRSLLTAPMKSV